MATIDTSKTYVLTNSFTGPLKALSISSGSTSLSMADVVTGGTDTQEWLATSAGISGYYRLHIASLGTSQSLDVINDNGVDSINVYMTATGQYTGQYWRFDTWSSGGGYRLSNNFTGLDLHLDVYSDTLQAFLATGDHTGQHWTLGTPAATLAPSTTSIPSVSTSGAAPTTTTPISSATVESSSSGSNKSLSPGAIAGIAVGGIAIIAIVIGAAIFFGLRKRKSERGGGNHMGHAQHDPKQDMAAVAGQKKWTYDNAATYAPHVSELEAVKSQPLLAELPS
ncbi:hypothetical protein H072_8251 [Dactylellina haptotyla CBS 200.50]|uniref:Uncharacterized protein n=1 Tax=Dactylellina haptotyla (strain CBS 200.50) TaxID=1284197 RepID=S8BFF9_DACHA|nr:hypothetical protein H072_8251 [Dactylellina haptotyla CBS 200.50]